MAGFLNGFLGTGGGIAAVEALKSAGLDRRQSHVNSVAVVLPLSLFSAGLYLYKGNVALSDALPFIPWGMLGAAIGTYIIKKMSPKTLQRLFGGFMLWAGIRILMR